MHCCSTKDNSVRGISNSDERWSTQHVLSAHQTVSDEYSHCLNLCIATPSCHCLFSSKDFTSTMRKAGFSTSSLTKSHHFRRLTSACDKCSTSSSLPISLELETPESSTACKIKNDHLIHSSTKYISGERRKAGRREGVCHQWTTSLPFRILLNQLILNEALIQMDLCSK